jgi:AcrR family transcriptional regulator
MPQTAVLPARRRRERGSITRNEILTGAFEVAADVSVDNLSMPLLAKHLDVGVTSIYWYFRKKDELLDAMTDRALNANDFDAPIDARNWRESLRNHACKMRQAFLADPILCDLILIRGAGCRRAARDALKKMEQPLSALVSAGLSVEQAFDTYVAIATHVKASAVLRRLQQRIPLITETVSTHHRIAMPDDFNFGFILDCILDHAEGLIAERAESS